MECEPLGCKLHVCTCPCLHICILFCGGLHSLMILWWNMYSVVALLVCDVIMYVCCCRHDAASHTSFSINVCVYGHHGGGPHYLVRSHTDMATTQWGQLADLFLFPQLFNELVMGRTAQLPWQPGWTPTSEVGNLYILGSQAYANGPLVLSPIFSSSRMSFLFHPRLDMCANSALALKGGGWAA